MLHRLVQDLQGDTIIARDGEIGSLADAYFDDEHWRLRYLVIDTGRWLPGRQVLVSPKAAAQVDDDVLRVELSRSQIEGAPGIDADPPVSKLMRLAHQRQYVHPYTGPFLWGMLQPQSPAEREAARQAEQRAERSHVRSGKEVAGYRIRAADGELGHVEDVVVDDASWTITGMIVDTKSWLPGGHVVVPPSAVVGIDALRKEVSVRLRRDELKRAPEAS
jgi:sporulation protein YlmC with PRC-barrel domain